MKTRVILLIVFVGLGLILAAVPQNTTLKYKLTANEMLIAANNSVLYYTTDEVADLIVQNDPTIQLIDVRTPDEFEKFALPKAINIPLADLLSDEYRDYLDQDVYSNIFYSNGTTDALKAWMIAKQIGWANNFVMQGGLNYWAETIMNPKAPPSTSANDEIAKYEFRKGAQQALGGDGAVSDNAAGTANNSPKPPVIRKRKVKRAQGGC
jgi:sulfur-carrier protein adenylyltransferase/sulfurtransferase